MQLRRRHAHVAEFDARLRVEVEPELVHDLGTVVETGPDMEAEAREVDGPHDVRHVGEDERPRGRPVRRRDDRRLEPVRRRLGDALLEERASLGPVRKALHECRPPGDDAHERLGDGEVVAHEIELRLLPLGEEHLVRARHREVSPRDIEHVLLGHRPTVPADRRHEPPAIPPVAARASRGALTTSTAVTGR
jgi:hypothetical protein